MSEKKIGIIGAGNMGEALINGLSRTNAKIFVNDIRKERVYKLKKRFGAVPAGSNNELARKVNIIILAVKPQNIDEALLEIAPLLDQKKLIISVAAGIKTSYIEKKLANEVGVIRAMPNTPALVGKGISAICCGRFAKDNDRQIAVRILSSVGKVVEIKEELMDVVTGISGSGPAYFFFLMETLINAGIKHGLKQAAAKEFAIQTAFGAACLVAETKGDPSILRQKVTSKGGTTEAAFWVFEGAGLGDILQNGIEAAIKRAKSLATAR